MAPCTICVPALCGSDCIRLHLGVQQQMWGEVAKGAADTAGEALQRTGSLVEWGQQQANQVGATLYSSTIHPVLSFLWWFYLTLPYEAASWLAANSLALAQQAAGASLSAGHRVASTSSALINSLVTCASLALPPLLAHCSCQGCRHRVPPHPGRAAHREQQHGRPGEPHPAPHPRHSGGGGVPQPPEEDPDEWQPELKQ
ncbi:hypothetical protein HaLaN_03428 [Haematococcus lacustris]|uniref:Uncharacterized protein n=1 Tax=Haematococcus lacustris TaxID=44745 RepID=A0A699YE93_HAELA|nr:hypothetical protein HaLaN_03428 [Haematococcus lacustris]